MYILYVQTIHKCKPIRWHILYTHTSVTLLSSSVPNSSVVIKVTLCGNNSHSLKNHACIYFKKLNLQLKIYYRIAKQYSYYTGV